MSQKSCFVFALIAFAVCALVAGYAVAFFVQEFGGALNPSIQFQGNFPLAFLGTVAALAAIVLPISAILLK